MEAYCWKTEEALSNNESTMENFVSEHWLERFDANDDIIIDDGTYLEVKKQDGTVWAVNASGNGDFCNHKIEFEQLS